MNYLESEYIEERKDYIKGIPIIRFYPKNSSALIPTIFFYHGWSSNKESQRMRAFILSSLGYQVIVPESIHHGERGIIDYMEAENMAKYFWPVVLSNIEEFKHLKEHSISYYQADPNRLGVTGHSMGGFTASGIFTDNLDIKVLVVFNGSCNWKHSNSIFKDLLNLDPLYEKEIEKKVTPISSMDPMANRNFIINRPILLLHGNKDSLVNIESQRIFYKNIRLLYEDRSKIKLIEYKDIDHILSLGMIEDSLIWFKKYL